jgi:hypothetical protein
MPLPSGPLPPPMPYRVHCNQRGSCSARSKGADASSGSTRALAIPGALAPRAAGGRQRAGGCVMHTISLMLPEVDLSDLRSAWLSGDHLMRHYEKAKSVACARSQKPTG